MNDISAKKNSMRSAVAEALLRVSPATVPLIRENRLPKGNLYDVARAAGMLGAKMTPQLIPHCHPVRIDALQISFEWPEAEVIRILVEAKSVDRTGIEMEALTAASVTALTMLDLLKIVDGNLSIEGIRLLEKKGGKSAHKLKMPSGMEACILVCSDSTIAAKRSDESGARLAEILGGFGVSIREKTVVPDDVDRIRETVSRWRDADVDFIFCTGGTGLSPRDNTPEAIRPLLDREAIGIGEAMRSHGYQRTALAAFSRSFAGTMNRTLVIALPGSTRAVSESLDAILPELFHLRDLLKGDS